MSAATALPTGWSELTLGDVCSSITDGTHYTPNYVTRGGVPFYSVESITNDNFTNVKQISIAEHRRLVRRCRPERGDILMTRIGSLAETKYIDWNIDASIYVSLALLKPGPSIDGRYLYAYTKSSEFVRAVEDRALLWAAPKKINMGDISGVPISVPSNLSEQHAIADVLFTLEDNVKCLERLIAKKQAIKQGMMQQLLTGRTRLPGFTGEWTDIRLGDHVSYVKTVALSRAQLDTKSPLKYLHYGDIHTRSSVLLDSESEEMPRASVKLAARAGWLQRGDLVFADASEDPAGVGKSVEIVDTPSTGVVPGLHTIAARFDKSVLVDGFKAYLQFIPSFRDQLLRLAAGTKVLATTRSYISSITLTLPDVAEQTAIADVLLDAGREIEALGIRLSKAQDIKAGVMQQLLTGRTRLPVEAAL